MVLKFFTAKYNTSGQLVWVQTPSSQQYIGSGAYAVRADEIGNVYVAGSWGCGQNGYIAFGSDTLISDSASNKIFITKYNTDGIALWVRDAGGLQVSQASALATDKNGNVYTTGFFETTTIRFGNYVLTNNNPLINADIFIVKYDSSGNVLFAKSVGGHAYDAGAGICIDPWGDAYIVGTIESPSVVFGHDTLINSEIGTVFTAKFSFDTAIATSLNNIPQSKDEILVYPNPSNGRIFFENISNGCMIEIYDMVGQIIYSNMVNEKKVQVDLDSKSKGLYFYKISVNNSVVSNGKVVLQ
jgi:hypothetical protein